MKSTLLIILCSFFVGLGCGYDPSFSETPFLCAQSGDFLVFPEEEKCPEGYTCDTETDVCVLNGIEPQPQPQPEPEPEPEQPSDCPEGCFCGRIEMICP